jgi:membrane associated rhomboid family serine protease
MNAPMNAPVTLILVAITCLVSWQAWERQRLFDRLILWPPAIDRKREYDRLIGHGFIHADGVHLVVNMLTLYSFGGVMEAFFSQRIGMVGFLAFYLSAIVIAILPTYLRHRRDSRYRSLGASGAVSAVLFSSVLLDPWAGIVLFFILPLPAIVFAVLYVGYSIWMDKRGGDNINHSAHLWGALYGMVFALAAEPRLGMHFLQRLASPGSSF